MSKISVGDSVVIPHTRQIKQVQEIEMFDDVIVLYMTDGTAHGIEQCQTVHQAYDQEINKLALKWKI